MIRTAEISDGGAHFELGPMKVRVASAMRGCSLKGRRRHRGGERELDSTLAEPDVVFVDINTIWHARIAEALSRRMPVYGVPTPPYPFKAIEHGIE